MAIAFVSVFDTFGTPQSPTHWLIQQSENRGGEGRGEAETPRSYTSGMSEKGDEVINTRLQFSYSIMAESSIGVAQ